MKHKKQVPGVGGLPGLCFIWGSGGDQWVSASGAMSL